MERSARNKEKQRAKRVREGGVEQLVCAWIQEVRAAAAAQQFHPIIGP